MYDSAHLKGRPAIRSWMAAAFDGEWKGTHVLGIPRESRYISDNVCVVITEGGAYQPGATEVRDQTEDPGERLAAVLSAYAVIAQRSHGHEPELADYCLHALAAARGMTSAEAVHRLVEVTLTGLQPKADRHNHPVR